MTGGAAGMGYFVSERLAGLGARVTIAARNAERAERAVASIRAIQPDAAIGFVRLDLASLASARDAASAIADAGPVDGLVANAGVLPWERAGDTEDGFEAVFGTNQLGHFALAARLWPSFTSDAVLVALGSVTHRGQRLDFADLESREVNRGRRYGRSKLAVMTTAVELSRRIRSAGLEQRSVIAHPGYASGALDPVRPGIAGERRSAATLGNAAFRGIIRGWANSKQEGAEIIAAATVVGTDGECWGPEGGALGLKGRPRTEPLAGVVLDPEAGRRLWAASEELTGVEWAVSPRR